MAKAKANLSANGNHTGSGMDGSKTPNLDWRPPVLTPWAKSSMTGGSGSGNDSTSDIEAQRLETSSAHGIPYPSQTYAAHGRKGGARTAGGVAGGVFGFMRTAANGFSNGRKKSNRGGAFGEDDGTYLMVNGGSSPPVGSPPPQYLIKNGDVERKVQPSQEDVRLGGATSPPLPPLPPAAATANGSRKSAARSASLKRVSKAASGKAVPAPIIPPPRTSTSTIRPLSRAPTNKSRHTASSSLNGHAAVPSPRVSSLFRASSRLSQHHGGLASPGLPDPSIPPMPALPAHLFRTPSLSKKSGTDSMGSMDNNPRHNSSLSSFGGDASDAAAADASMVMGPDGPEDPTKGLDGKPLPRTMVVTCTFTPGLSDELPLSIGETVSMLEEYIDEWCFVQRVQVMVQDGKGQGVTVSVHGTIDPVHTVVVPVPGEGNLGAVPRFCLSEWPLVLAEEDEEEQEEVQETKVIGQETPTGLQPLFTPPAVLPSPPTSSTTPTFIPGRGDAARQPLLAPTSYLQSTTNTPGRSRPLPTPKAPIIPEESLDSKLHLDSKFSSWGSVATQMPLPMQSLGVPSTESGTSRTSAASHIHPLANDSRTPSISSATTSLSAPIPPPTSPASQSPGGLSPAATEAEDDSIKRISKPPQAPRMSRFPPTPDDEEPPVHHHHHPMRGTGHTRNGSRGAEGLPRAAERTVTMPPLPRRPSATDPSTADSPTPSSTPMYQKQQQQQQQQPYSIPALPNSNIAGIKDANAHWATVHSAPVMTPSTSNDLPGTSASAGTSAGSKTPSTAATSASVSNTGFGKRFTTASQVSRSGSFTGPMGSNSSFGPRPAAGSGEKKAGPGIVSAKGWRTGSSVGR